MRYRQRRRHAYPYADERACAARGPKRLEPLGYIQPVRAFRLSLPRKKNPDKECMHFNIWEMRKCKDLTFEGSFSAESKLVFAENLQHFQI